MNKSDEYLVDVILPKHELHLLAGPSGAGKTRWLLPTLLDWEKGASVLGYESYPTSWAYFASDRQLSSVKRTLIGMNIKPSSMKVLPVWDKHLKWHQVLDAVAQCKEELVVIESFGGFIQGTHTGPRVKEHIEDAYRCIQQTGKTIIGIVESPKSKAGNDRYDNPRQRISGAAAWAHYSETIMLVEAHDSEDPTCDIRTLYLCPRNAPTQIFQLQMIDGHLKSSE